MALAFSPATSSTFSGISTATEPPAGLRWQWQLLLFVLAALAIASHRPDAFLNPQFYAEDGAVWYGDAYNHGWWHSLLIPAGGYSNLFPRLVAGVALLIPLGFAPLLMNIVGLVVALVPVTLLLSARCSGWGPLPLRLAQAAFYVALPNSREIGIVLTNAQWRLALIMLLLAFATPPQTWRAKTIVIAVLTVSGLTGPFGIALLPMAIFFWWKRRWPFTRVVIGILSATALAQIAELIFHPGARPRLTGYLGATPALLVRLLSGKIFVTAFRGENVFALHATLAQAVLVTALGLGFLVYCVYKANLELRLFICFSALLLAGSLRSPLIAGPTPQWQVLELVPGIRYWFFPTLVFIWSVLWFAAQSRPAILRPVGMLAILFLARGASRDWRYPPFIDEHFAAYVQRFNAAAPGTKVDTVLYPGTVTMRLLKKR